MLHETGVGVARDAARAEDLYADAAAQGDMAAMLNLACLRLDVRCRSQETAVASLRVMARCAVWSMPPVWAAR